MIVHTYGCQCCRTDETCSKTRTTTVILVICIYNVSRSDVVRWRRPNGILHYRHSSCLKKFQISERLSKAVWPEKWCLEFLENLFKCEKPTSSRQLPTSRLGSCRNSRNDRQDKNGNKKVHIDHVYWVFNAAISLIRIEVEFKLSSELWFDDIYYWRDGPSGRSFSLSCLFHQSWEQCQQCRWTGAQYWFWRFL